MTVYDSEGELIQFEKKEIKVEDLIPLIPKSAFHPRKINGIVYWGFSTTGVIPSIGKVRLVISFSNAKLEGSYGIRVTNRIDWEAKRIITGYLERWPIETFYQDSKQYLGVGEYQMRKMLAIQNHGYLVFLSYSLLHLDIMNSSLEKGKNRLQTIGEACRQQSQALVKSLVLWVHRQLSKGIRMETIMDTLYPKSSKLCIA